MKHSFLLLVVFALVFHFCSAGVNAPRFQTFCTGRGAENLQKQAVQFVRDTYNSLTGNQDRSLIPHDDVDSFRHGFYSVDEAFQLAWNTPNTLGVGCAHLATWSTASDLEQILASMAAVNTVASLIGARRSFPADDGDFYDNYYIPDDDEFTSDTNPIGRATYVFAAGPQRGNPFVSTYSIHDIQAEPVDFVTHGECLQDYCIDNMDEVYPVTDPAQTGLVLISNIGFSRTVRNHASLIPTDGASCYTVEYASDLFLPKVNGPPFFVPSVSDTYYNLNLNAISLGGFLARVTSDKQNSWISDEISCLADQQLAIGVVDYFNNFYLGPGPNEGTLLDCTVDYCGPLIVTRSVSFPGDDLSNGIGINHNGAWSLFSGGYSLVDYEHCSALGHVAICVPRESPDWLQYVGPAEAAQRVRAGLAFYAGGPYYYTFHTQDYVSYFDCHCKTSDFVNLACLGSNDQRTCRLYLDYYQYEYNHYGEDIWYYLYHHFEYTGEDVIPR